MVILLSIIGSSSLILFSQTKPENKFLRNVSSASSRASFFERRLSILTTGSSRPTGESADQIRASFGLNLLYEPPEPIVDFVFVRIISMISLLLSFALKRL